MCLQHQCERQAHAFLYARLVPGLYPLLQAERKVLRELLQLLQTPPHPKHQVLEFRLEIPLQAVTEQGGEPPEHGDGVFIGETDALEVVEAGEKLGLDGAGEEGGVGADVGDAEGAEEVEGGAEAGGDGGGEEAGAAAECAAEEGGVEAGLAEEEGGDGEEGGGGGGEDVGAHGEDAAEVGGGEGEGAEEMDGGSEV